MVVLCAREKLDMENLFRRVVPEPSRFGTRFVFRQVCRSLICMNAIRSWAHLLSSQQGQGSD